MQIDRQVVKQIEITLKHLSKDIRTGPVEAGKVAAISKLLDQYASLIKLAQDDGEESNYYSHMEAEVLADMKPRR